MVGLCGLLLDWRNLVKYKIKLQNVDARLAQNSELAVLGMGRNQLPQGIRAHAARGRHPRHLRVRGSRADVGIEAAAGPRQQIGGHWTCERGVLVAELLEVGLDTIHQGLIRGTEVGATRGKTIVAVASGGRGAAMEILRAREALPDEFRAGG